jgi:hypothetical protein
VSRRSVATLLPFALAAAAPLATSGCGQLLGFTLDYYEASDSSGPEAASDGPVDDGDASGDVTSEPSGDASGERDAAPPAEGGGTFCQKLSPQPYFCTDFDEGAGSPFGWSYADTVKGTLTLDTSEYTSAPASMLATTPVVMTSNVTVDTAVYKDVPSGPTTFGGTLDWDMRVDLVDAPGNVAVLAQIALLDSAGGGQYYLQVVATSNGATPLDVQLNEEFFSQDASTGMPFNHAVSGAIPPQMWTHLKLQMTVPASGGPGTATLVVGNQSATYTTQPSVPNIQATVGLGVLWSFTPSNGWHVLYDNVTFDSTSN